MIPIALHLEEPPARAAAAAIRPPALVAPAPREVSFGWVSGRVGAGTTRVRVLVDGELVRIKPVAGRGRFSLTVELPPRDVRVRVVAQNAAGERAGRTVRHVFGLPRDARPVRARGTERDGRLTRRVRRLARDFGGTAAAYAMDLRTGRGAAWNAGARFPAASTLKVAIAVETLRRLGRPAPGSRVDEQLRSMLVVSDNEAANALLVHLGGSTSGGAAHVNALMRSLGLRDSLMYGGYAVATAAGDPIPVRVVEQPAFGVGKYTTAFDLARLHRAVHQATRGLGPLAGTGFGRRDARYLLWILARVADPGKLDRFLPRLPVLHKAGWLPQARHDAGLVYWRGGAFVVAVMTWRASGVGTGADVLAGRVARAAYERLRALRTGTDDGRAVTA